MNLIKFVHESQVQVQIRIIEVSDKRGSDNRGSTVLQMSFKGIKSMKTQNPLLRPPLYNDQTLIPQSEWCPLWRGFTVQFFSTPVWLFMIQS